MTDLKPIIEKRRLVITVLDMVEKEAGHYGGNPDFRWLGIRLSGERWTEARRKIFKELAP